MLRIYCQPNSVHINSGVLVVANTDILYLNRSADACVKNNTICSLLLSTSYVEVDFASTSSKAWEKESQ